MADLAAVLTVSDSKSKGDGEDLSGPEAERILKEAGLKVLRRMIVPDEVEAVAAALKDLMADGAALIVTTGGTGVFPRDVTPEATRLVSEKEVPGLGELMRRVSLEKTPHAALSRAVACISGTTLIVNLPGSTGGVRDCLGAVLPVVPHALELLSGARDTRHEQT